MKAKIFRAAAVFALFLAVTCRGNTLTFGDGTVADVNLSITSYWLLPDGSTGSGGWGSPTPTGATSLGIGEIFTLSFLTAVENIALTINASGIEHTFLGGPNARFWVGDYTSTSEWPPFSVDNLTWKSHAGSAFTQGDLITIDLTTIDLPPYDPPNDGPRGPFTGPNAVPDYGSTIWMVGLAMVLLLGFYGKRPAQLR
jgi:hypothetical protein